MGTPGRPAAPCYRARANGIHYGTHSVPRLQLLGHIRFHRTEAPTSVNIHYSHYASQYVAIYGRISVAIYGRIRFNPTSNAILRPVVSTVDRSDRPLRP